MRILFLAPASNYHTEKWCKYFLSKNYEVSVISLTDGKIDGVNVYKLQVDALSDSGDFSKLAYFKTIVSIHNIVKKIKPDIISVHYASSYGILAGLSFIGKYSLSVWGSDIFAFPKKSILHRMIIIFSLYFARNILSTSKYMAEECAKYTNKQIHITPFGVDTKLFNPNNIKCHDTFVIGTVKSLSSEYGIDRILKAAHIIVRKRPDIPLKIRISGVGPQLNDYKQLCLLLGIDKITSWLGYLKQEEVAKEWGNIDVAIIPSRSESFGVSAVEAQATGIPVIISDIPGLKESTKVGYSSLVVSDNIIDDIANKIIYLYDNPYIRRQIGYNGREFVVNNFDIEKCFSNIEKLIQSVRAR